MQQMLPMMFWPPATQQVAMKPGADDDVSEGEESDRERRRELRREDKKPFSSSYKTTGFHIKKGGLPNTTKLESIEDACQACPTNPLAGTVLGLLHADEAELAEMAPVA